MKRHTCQECGAHTHCEEVVAPWMNTTRARPSLSFVWLCPTCRRDWAQFSRRSSRLGTPVAAQEDR